MTVIVAGHGGQRMSGPFATLIQVDSSGHCMFIAAPMTGPDGHPTIALKGDAIVTPNNLRALRDLLNATCEARTDSER